MPAYQLWTPGTVLPHSSDMSQDFLAFDTETCLADLKKEIPDGVLLTAWTGGDTPVSIVPVEQWSAFVGLHLDRHWVGHNTSFDFFVILKQLAPTLHPSWISLVEQGRMGCTMLLDGLVRIASGDADLGTDKKPTRNLEVLCTSYSVDCAPPDKASPYRKRFAELLDEPDWTSPSIDPGFFEYAAKDCIATYRLACILYQQAWAYHHAIDKELLHPKADCWGPLTHGIQMRAAIALADVSRRGFYIDVEHAWRFEAHLRNEYQQHITWLELNCPGLIQTVSLRSRTSKRGKRKLSSKTGVASFSNKRLRLVLSEIAESLKIEAPISKGKEGWISLSAKDWSHLSEQSEFIHHWVRSVEITKQLSFMALFRETPENDTVLRSRYITIVRTGRTSCIAAGMRVDVLRDVSKDSVGIPIEQVKAGDYVYGYDANNKLCIREVLWAGKTGTKKVIRLHWQGSGHQHTGYLDLTEDHLVRLTTGEYIPAGKLQPKDRVSALHRLIDKKSGYARLFATGYKKDLREHSFIYHHFTGEKPEAVHHWDENKLNNVIDNLDGTTKEDHAHYHTMNLPREVRAARGSKAAKGKPSPFKGVPNPYRRLTFTRSDLLEMLEMYNYSLTRIVRELPIDYAVLKRNFIENGFTLEEIKAECRARRKDSLLAAAAYARECKKNNHEIIAIEYLPDEVDVYDITVEGIHNFIVEEICVHNCWNPNIQQIPREAEFRHLFTARLNKSLWIVDYSFIELRTLAYLCEKWLGKSELGKAIRAGRDPHTHTASQIFQKPYEQVKQQLNLEKSETYQGEKWASHMRQSAKSLNFGLPGGLGAPRLSAYAKANYGVDMSVEMATTLRDKLINSIYPELNANNGWLATRPIETLSRNLEIPYDTVFSVCASKDPNFQRLSICLDRVLRGTAFKADGTPYNQRYVQELWALAGYLLSLSPKAHLVTKDRFNTYSPGDDLGTLFFMESAVVPTGRIRRGVGYTDSRNTPFQGLAADGAKLTLWNLWKEGFETVAFIHDEVVVEINNPEQGHRINQIMISSMEEVLEGFPVDVEGKESKVWKK